MNGQAVMAEEEVLPCQREAFTLPEDVHYLNCAYFSPLPKVVEAAGIARIQQKRTPTVVHPPDFFAESNCVREHFARLVGVPEPNRVAIIPAARSDPLIPLAFARRYPLAP